MADRVRIGMIGCGGIAQSYLRALRKRQDVALDAFCDINRAAAEAAAEGSPEASVHTDFVAMLDERADALDAVFLALPPSVHGPLEQAVAGAGLAVFASKPVDLDLARARASRDAFSSAGVVTAAGYMMRYSSTLAELKRRLAGRRIAMIASDAFVRMRPGKWWGQRAVSGGQIVEQATHNYDLVRYMAGDPETVYCAGQKLTGRDVADFEDGTVASVLLTSGATASLRASFTCEGGPGGFTLDVIAEGLRAQWAFRNERLELWEEGGRHTTIEVAGGGWDAMIAGEVGAFVEVVGGGGREKILSDFADAVETLRFTLAAERSLAQGQPVAVRDLE